jgi:serine/threonine-protein kinase
MATISGEEKYDVVWGSPYYFSPEQASGKPPSPATDVYSLGVIAYELMTGQLPFNAEDSAELARMHRIVLPKLPKAINPEIPDPLNQIILRSLSKDPNDRQCDGVKFHNELAGIDLPIINSRSIHQVLKKPGARLSTENFQPDLHSSEIEKVGALKPSTIILAIFALIFTGGLIPFWLYVFLQINLLNR